MPPSPPPPPSPSSRAMGRRSKISHFFYKSVYVLFYIVLLGLLLITPGDIIDRSVDNRQYFNIWVLAVAYIVTVVVVGFVYALRLYINKTVLSSIPKGWVPIQKGDVKHSVHDMIELGLSRSAAIAYAARPRVETGEQRRGHTRQRSEPPRDGAADDSDDQQRWTRSQRQRQRQRQPRVVSDTTVSPPSRQSVWGNIEHDGWSSPNSSDLPSLQYATVLSEVPNLIEAKALTLAPPDPTCPAETPMMDPEAVALLQRLPHMSLRDYIERLAELGIVAMDGTASDFLAQYERARFSGRALPNTQFRRLMHLFAEILRAMRPLDPSILDHEPFNDEEDDDDDESDIDNDAPARSDYSSQRSSSPRPSTTGSHASSVRRPLRERATGIRRPADSDSRSQRSARMQTSRRPYTASHASSASLQSGHSVSRSLIRLATREDDTDLPYVLSLRDSAGSAYRY